MEQNYKKIIIALAAVAVVLLGVLIFVYVDRNSIINDLTIEKDDLTAQMVELQNDYANLSTANDTLNAELALEKEKVAQLLERVKKTEANNKAKLLKYERELGTLRTIMRGYIKQIDSLNTLNTELRVAAAKAKKEAKESKTQYENLKSTTEELGKQVELGAIVKGRGVTMVAVTENTDDTFLKFQNVGGYLKLQLYGDDMTVKSITLTGNKNEKLAGAATITAVYGQDPTISMANDATNSITLDCGEGVKIGASAETATAFWIVVPPTTFENGFEVTITDVNDNGMTKSTSNEISIVRNTIKPMEAFEVKTITKVIAVDLGLSVKWANCNIGANSPEEYGNYFAWGDIETKSDFYENNCITYGKDSGQLISYGFVDRNILKPRYDAAAMNWENNWRLPTQKEMQELVDNCTWTWITQNGVYGCLVTGTNGNSIFLPATGYRVFDQPAIYAERFGYYWTSTAYYETPNDDKSYGLSFGWDDYFQDIIYNLTGSNRSYGYTIRPVQE